MNLTKDTKNTVQTNKNIPYYLSAIVLFLLFKFGYTLAENNDLSFLLKPTNKLVGLLTGSHSVYLADKGYFHESLNIFIDKSCSGFNFWILSFIIFTYSAVKYFEKPLQKLLTIPTALIGAYLLTIFVNTSRIIASLVVHNQTKDTFQNHQHLLHEGIGVTTNLTFLIFAYILIEKLLTHIQHNAKFT